MSIASIGFVHVSYAVSKRKSTVVTTTRMNETVMRTTSFTKRASRTIFSGKTRDEMSRHDGHDECLEKI
jgi:hypothetical protein